MLRKATATVAGLAMAASLMSVAPATAQEPYREPANEVASPVTNWGISGACRNLEGRWNAFDDFCRSNGHI